MLLNKPKITSSDYETITYPLFGISLILSESKKRLWLKVVGIFIFSFGLLSFIATVWVFNSLTALHDGSATKMSQWTSMIQVIESIFFLLNFNIERLTSKKRETYKQIDLSSAIRVVAISAFLCLSFYGYKLTTEIKSLTENTNFNEHESKLAQPFESRNYANDHGETLPYRLL